MGSRCRMLRTTLRVFVAAILVVQLLGCGTILYPERRGQPGLHDFETVLNAILAEGGQSEI